MNEGSEACCSMRVSRQGAAKVALQGLIITDVGLHLRIELVLIYGLLFSLIVYFLVFNRGVQTERKSLTCLTVCLSEKLPKD